MSVIEIIPLIGIGVGALLSITSVLLSVFLKRKADVSSSSQFQRTSSLLQSSLASQGFDFLISSTYYGFASKDLVERVDQVLDHVSREKKRGQKSEEEALNLFVEKR